MNDVILMVIFSVAVLSPSAAFWDDITELRLINGSDPCSGTPEVFHRGSWTRMCHETLHYRNAMVMCRHLNCGNIVSVAHKHAPVENIDSENLFIPDVFCKGSEKTLADCTVVVDKCNNYVHSVINCSDSVRLVDGDGFCSGRVEIKSHQSWFTVCESDFDWQDAEVVCRELGCGTPRALQGALYGEGKGPVWTQEFRCEGTESHLLNCTASTRDEQTCTRADAVRLTCSEPDNVKLVGGSSKCAGMLEMFYKGQWRKVTAYSWNMKMTSFVCRQLNCGSVVSTILRTIKNKTSSIRVDECVSALRECQITERTYTESLEVICSDSVRLVGGAGFCSGRVEIKSHQSWFTVCESDFDWQDAEVVCRELGCGTPQALQGALYGDVKSPGWTQVFRCEGTESHLLNCPASTRDEQTCTRADAVGLTCSEPDNIRLVGGSSKCDGVVEMFYNGAWTKLSYSSIMKTSSLVCRQLDCGSFISSVWRSVEDRSLGMTAGCEGTEFALRECQIPRGDFFGYSREVICSDSVRLVDGDGFCSGRVEIKSHQSWFTVCESDFDWQDAEVVCRELGCGTPRALQGALYGEGKGPVWTQEFRCEGTESHLLNCTASTRDEQTCTQVSAMGLTCSKLDSVRLVKENSRCAGFIDSYYRQQWWGVGTIHRPEAELVCRQLGCGSLVAFSNAMNQNEHKVCIQCNGSESELNECSFTPYDWLEEMSGFVICSGLLNQPKLFLFTSISASWGPQEPQVFRGHSFRITCSVDPYYPEGTVYLKVPWSNISYAHPAVNHSASFFFRTANDSHQGKYSCVHQHRINFNKYERLNNRYGNYIGPLIHTFSSESDPLSLVVTDSALTVEMIRMALIPFYFLTFWIIFLIFKKWGALFLTHTEHKKPATIQHENTEMISLQSGGAES